MVAELDRMDEEEEHDVVNVVKEHGMGSEEQMKKEEGRLRAGKRSRPKAKAKTASKAKAKAN